ncbi:TraR/DksA C4-type zinc finger protein [Algiphilus sp. NNCM1]|uniref:TraR/DksA family transcriptional regulator n=1 Tax=Algiphilus sp. TaxID=1872431 RepID=UPI001CA65223|nr:TraR/DksA C4-type zinc finger protein [Algiphilus sp.]MBY8965938.1 TraR/DksA C4-type zinc finger protein [Algiphilus acroporae]MCI5062463.1 TraR/DksA C4-type zinc finger protein [Algiphilus sp.]MCI5103463.1 TraR/DksA C4-type zinc finger protein [Algiphilus sp.]
MTEDLDPATLDHLSRELHALAQQLSEALSRSDASASTVELDQTRVGRVSRGDALQQQAMAQAGRRVLQQRLNAVHAALQRLQQGFYGYCVDCEEAVALARLQRQPEAARCIACQSARE